MNETGLMPTTVEPSWLGRLLKRMLLPFVLALTGCCGNIATTPRLPAPAADLMQPVPTGSELSARVTRNMGNWEQMLQGGQTN